MSTWGILIFVFDLTFLLVRLLLILIDVFCPLVCSSIMVFSSHIWDWGSRRSGTWCGYPSVWLRIRSPEFMTVWSSYFRWALIHNLLETIICSFAYYSVYLLPVLSYNEFVEMGAIALVAILCVAEHYLLYVLFVT